MTGSRRDVVSLREVSHASARRAACDPPWIPGDVRPAGRRTGLDRQHRRDRARLDRHGARRKRHDSSVNRNRRHVRDRPERRYTALFLVPGTYEVQVTLQGFKSWVRSGLVLQVNHRAARRRVARGRRHRGDDDRVGQSPLVRTDSSEVGTVIEERAIKELPLNGRNFATLVYLMPGVTPGQAGENLSGASTFNPRGASNFNALGHQANTNAWLVDGIDNNEYTFNTVIVAPSVEQVREFKVLSGVFSAEFGRGAGVVSVSTKSGTQPAARHRVRVPAQRRVRRPELLRAQGAAGRRLADEGSGAPLDRHQFGAALGGAW